MYKEGLAGPRKVVVGNSTLEPKNKNSVLVMRVQTNADKNKLLSVWGLIPSKRKTLCVASGKSSECAPTPLLEDWGIEKRWMICKRCLPPVIEKLNMQSLRMEDALWRERQTLKKPMRCTACVKSSECAKIPDGPGVRHSNVWVCKRCWTTEMRERRSHNTTRGLFRGNPDRLACHPWPKRRRIRKLETLIEDEDTARVRLQRI